MRRFGAIYKIENSKSAKKQAEFVKQNGLSEQVLEIRETVRINPFEKSQGFEELKGKHKGIYTRRINKQHRFVYAILPNTDNLKAQNGEVYEGIIRVVGLWGHFP